MTALPALPVVPLVSTYSLAKQGVFRTIQGEGVMLGVPMVFVRLAGCPVGCVGCDTNYAPKRDLTLEQLVDIISCNYYGSGYEWVWLTGGEPTVYDLYSLCASLRARLFGVRIAVATSGINRLHEGRATGGVDFLSVSPHGPASTWVQRSGSQLNLVPGLNGLRLDDPDMLDALHECAGRFSVRYVTPLHDSEESYRQAVSFVQTRRGWRLGAQAHVDSWRIP